MNTPTLGFVFPAFIDRTSDVNSVMYYTKNAKDPHPELMEETLGCFSKQTATIQKETFQTIIKDSISTDEKKAEKTFMEIQENLNTMIDEYNSIYDDKDDEPITLKQKDIQNLLLESGVPEEATYKIEKSYVENFGEDLPLAEHLIDSKVLKANAQKKKEEQLEKQVEILQHRLEEVKKETSMDNEADASKKDDEDNETLEDDLTNDLDNALDDSLKNNSDDFLDDVSKNDLNDALENNLEESPAINSDDNNLASDYDVILQVKPEKIPKIKAQIIDGQKCIVIPIDENEQTTVNGLNDLI